MKLKDILNEVTAPKSAETLVGVVNSIFKNDIPENIPFPINMGVEDKEAIITLLTAYKKKYKNNIPNLLNTDALNRTEPELYRSLISIISRGILGSE